MLILLVLIPIYTFLMMYYRHMLRNFFMAVFKKENEQHVKHVLSQSKSIVQNYMLGLMIEMAIVAALNAVGFMIIGIDYAIFLAVLAAIMNLVLYTWYADSHCVLHADYTYQCTKLYRCNMGGSNIGNGAIY